MRIEYDQASDSAEIYLVGEIKSGEAARQIEVSLPDRPVEVYLDLDEDGFLLGIEILGASTLLRADVLAGSDRTV